MTQSMRTAIDETSRRRAKQLAYNQQHGITPQSIVKAVDMQLARIVDADYVTVPVEEPVLGEIASEEQLRAVIAQLEAQMREAAKKFEFERAAALRDRIRALKQRDLEVVLTTPVEASGPIASAEPAPVTPAIGARPRRKKGP
jgi:excinuclease ABC subunit B